MVRRYSQFNEASAALKANLLQSPNDTVMLFLRLRKLLPNSRNILPLHFEILFRLGYKPPFQKSVHDSITTEINRIKAQEAAEKSKKN